MLVEVIHQAKVGRDDPGFATRGAACRARRQGGRGFVAFPVDQPRPGNQRQVIGQAPAYRSHQAVLGFIQRVFRGLGMDGVWYRQRTVPGVNVVDGLDRPQWVTVVAVVGAVVTGPEVGLVLA
ncbi:hypothetical protein D3C77_603030 [compost metagenome]